MSEGYEKSRKKIKNPLTNLKKYVIIKMSKGKSEAKTLSVRLEKILGKAEKST